MLAAGKNIMPASERDNFTLQNAHTHKELGGGGREVGISKLCNVIPWSYFKGYE